MIINEALARAALPGEDPLGMSLDIGYARTTDSRPREIVGIVEDVREAGLDRPAPPAYYVPYRQDPFSSMFIVAHTSVDPSTLVGSLRREVREMDVELAVLDAGPLGDLVSASLAGRRFTVNFMGAFAAAALLLAVLGIYGVMSYAVNQRRSEIGVRIAMGATRRDVLGLVLRNGMLLAVIGVVTGLLASAAITRYLASMLFEIEATDPATFAGVALILVGVATLGTLVPAYRATLVDPLEALRSE